MLKWNKIDSFPKKDYEWYLVSGMLYPAMAVRWDKKQNQVHDCMGYQYALERFQYWMLIGDVPGHDNPARGQKHQSEGLSTPPK